MSLLTALRAEKDVCLGIARFNAPFETGNLRFNAISAHDTPDGFVITYDLSSAYYTYFLEEGTKFTQKHVGFISNRTYPAIASYINAKFVDNDEKLVGLYLDDAKNGNSDIFKNKQKYGNARLALREARLYDSALANMVTYGHMSNEFNWKHNVDNEQFQPNLRQKF